MSSANSTPAAADPTSRFSRAEITSHLGSGEPTPSVASLVFEPDDLGPGFQRHFVEMGPDPDGETPVRLALIRYRPDESDCNFFHRPAVIFIHGMTDYFFHAHVAHELHARGYAVYGLDLRKCGRAWREGQTWHHVTDQALYDEDITIAATLIAAAHGSVVVEGHSTGGLDVATWAGRLNAAAEAHPDGPEAQLQQHLRGVVLNSPWLGLQLDPVSAFVSTYIFPLLIRVFPDLGVPGGITPAYGRSLHISEHGEWDYDLRYKPLAPRPKKASWLVGVIRQQRGFMRHPMNTGVPTIMFTSERHHFAKHFSLTQLPPTLINRWAPQRAQSDLPSIESRRAATDGADLILKPKQMRARIGRLAPHAEIVVLKDALHDVFLSRRAVRDRAIDELAEWLAQVAPAPHLSLIHL
ncbi:alpha/beta fold hydrolase, partial [Corynebacterium heidelbergense]